jgi:biotin transporter BioY
MSRGYRLLLLPLALLLGWLIRHFSQGKSVSVQTASSVVGGMVVLALLGVAFGFRTARASEKRRKAKEDIWLKH